MTDLTNHWVCFFWFVFDFSLLYLGAIAIFCSVRNRVRRNRVLGR